MDKSNYIGKRVSAVFAVLDELGEPVALQIVFSDGTSLVCTVWTDWSLRMEIQPDAAFPEYLSPRVGSLCREIIEEIPKTGLMLSSVVFSKDELGVLMGVEFGIGDYVVAARSFAGEIVLDVAGHEVGDGG